MALNNFCIHCGPVCSFVLLHVPVQCVCCVHDGLYRLDQVAKPSPVHVGDCLDHLYQVAK